MHFFGALIDDPQPTIVLDGPKERCTRCGGSGFVCTHTEFENKVQYHKCKECENGWRVQSS